MARFVTADQPAAGLPRAPRSIASNGVTCGSPRVRPARCARSRSQGRSPRRSASRRRCIGSRGRRDVHPPAPAQGDGALPSTCELLGRRRAFGRRPDARQVESARELFLAAARADESGRQGPARRGAGQRVADRAREGRRAAGRPGHRGRPGLSVVRRRAPTRVECTYRLALALGQQARERPTTANDALPRIVALLEQVIAADAGARRRRRSPRPRAHAAARPGWPAGPGDPDAGLEHARAADTLVPTYPPNLLRSPKLLPAREYGTKRAGPTNRRGRWRGSDSPRAIPMLANG